jgi:hypothetical protein
MADEDKVQMVDIKPSVVTEKSPFVEGEGVVSTDDVIQELFAHRTWKYNLLVMSLVLSCLGGPTAIYITSFAGISVQIFEIKFKYLKNNLTLNLI